MVNVTLTPPEVLFALGVATQRDACKADRAHRMSRKTTGFGVHFIGAVGEIAARKVYGGKLNLDVLPDGDKHAPDLVLADGRRVEVKASTFTGMGVTMKFQKDELGKSEHYCLVQVSLPDTVTVHPVLAWADIKDKLQIAQYGHGDCLVYSL